jgi:hypothetical protein
MGAYVERTVRALVIGQERPVREVRAVLGNEREGPLVQAEVESNDRAVGELESVCDLEMVRHLGAAGCSVIPPLAESVEMMKKELWLNAVPMDTMGNSVP